MLVKDRDQQAVLLGSRLQPFSDFGFFNQTRVNRLEV